MGSEPVHLPRKLVAIRHFQRQRMRGGQWRTWPPIATHLFVAIPRQVCNAEIVSVQCEVPVLYRVGCKGSRRHAAKAVTHLVWSEIINCMIEELRPCLIPMLVCSGVDEVAIFAAPPQSINEAKICIANCAVSNKYDAFSRRYARTIIPGSLAHLLLTRLVANAAHLASASAVISRVCTPGSARNANRRCATAETRRRRACACRHTQLASSASERARSVHIYIICSTLRRDRHVS